MQLFTRTPNQWREPELSSGRAAAFRSACEEEGVIAVLAHDSYLINLASPDPELRARSERSLSAELERCRVLAIPWIVSHPGNYMDDRGAGLVRNAESYARCLDACPGPVGIAIETTAGSGTALGASFEEIAELLDRVPAHLRPRLGVCADTCHLWAAGYNLAGDYEGVWREFDSSIGLKRLVAMHLNDSREGLGSRVDRHALIGKGRIGAAAFRRIMSDARFQGVVRIIETPKGDDEVTNDRLTLRRLRTWARSPHPTTARR
jgi:deoxyribonuclease-4